ncbi:MAG: hypothetical protein BWY31_02514 [Lentisphaerae bacterium ADurb.Bin242]|nr:MAG: hypothetical protein BWY31_02514 [Lentisphaerae bacterium ADurb.Bin242]
MKRTLFAAAGVLQILFWSLYVRQVALYMGNNFPVWCYGWQNPFGWPIESWLNGWTLHWAPLLFNLAVFSGLFLVVCAAAFCLSGKSRERCFLAYALPTLPFALAGMIISVGEIHHRQFFQMVFLGNFLFPLAFLLFSWFILFRKGIQWGLSKLRLEEPYENYSLYSKLPPEELRRRLAELCSQDTFFPWSELKAVINPSFTVFILRQRQDGLVLFPLSHFLNSFRAELRLKIHQHENGTRLDVTALIPKGNRTSLWGMSIFLLLLSFSGLFFGLWQTIFILAFFPGMFGIIGLIRSTAELELPEIRRGLETLLRKVEES